ncbi:MAG: nickel insertion protein [Chloroflexaceae bacterium]
MRVAYFDCVHGAVGNMLLTALLDAGLNLANLQNGPERVWPQWVHSHRAARAQLRGDGYPTRLTPTAAVLLAGLAHFTQPPKLCRALATARARGICWRGAGRACSLPLLPAER